MVGESKVPYLVTDVDKVTRQHNGIKKRLVPTRLQPLSFLLLWSIVAALLLAGITISCSGTTQAPAPTPITIRKFVPHGKRIAMTADYGNGNVQRVQIWDVAAGKELLSFSTQLRDIYDLVWSPDGARLASASYDRTVQLWNATTGKPLQSFHDSALEAIVWSPDGRYILSSLTASVTKDTSLRVWDVATGRKLLTYSGHSGNVYEAQWTPDSTRIASVSQQEVLVWNASTGHTILSLPTTSSGIAVLSPDGKYLAYSRGDSSIQVWNTISGNEFLTYVGPTAHIQAIAWSRDSTRIAFASDDSTVQIWDTITKNTFYTYHVASNSVQNLVWSPDNKLLATASQDNTLQVLQAD